MILAFIDELRADGHAVESICRVLRQQGCQIAARTYRAWARPGHKVADRTITDLSCDVVPDLQAGTGADLRLRGARCD